MQSSPKEETTPTVEFISRAATPMNDTHEKGLRLQAQETKDLDRPLLLDYERHGDAM